MIGEIGHLGKVSPRKGIASALLYTLGAMLSATAVGGALGLAGAWLRGAVGVWPGPAATFAVLAAMALLGGLQDLRILRLPLPQRRRQVHQSWMQVFGPYWTGLFWGLEIGSGVMTLIQFTPFYLLVAWAFLAARPAHSAAVFAVLGLTQGLLLVAETAAMGRGRAGSGGILGASRTEPLHRLCGVCLVALASFLAAGLAHGAWIRP